MKPEIKKIWVEALRSGDYKQGNEALRPSNDTFCCLGVLCNLHAQAHPELAATETNKHYYLDNDTFLPPMVMEWAGLNDTSGGRVTFKGETDWITAFNDGTVDSHQTLNFKQLATIINKQF